MICKSYQRSKGKNRDYCSNFSVTLETPSKFLIVFVKLILGKREIDRVTGPWQKSDVRWDNDFHLWSKE